MASYVYRCTQCQKEFEVDKAMSRSMVNEPCPTCGRTGERVFTAPGIQIKGSEIKSDCGTAPACSGCEHGCCDLD
jgi:putative FmdB family regulatory protein